MEISISHFGVENDLYQECLKIRYEVLRKPLGMQITERDRELDLTTTHILLKVDGKPAGTVGLIDNHLRQMAVLQEFQGLKLGVRLVQYLEQLAKTKGIQAIELEARGYAIPFYEKCGYAEYGEFYEKVGMPHRMMKKDF
jgi:GNAT superfamily N-acetyltransferase